MDSIDSLLAIQLPLSDSESSSSTSSSTSNNEDLETDTEDNVNNEDDHVDVGSNDDDIDEAVIYAEEMINSSDLASRYDTSRVTVVAVTTPQTSSQLPIALPYATPPPPPPPSSAKTSRFVSASSAAAAAAKGPPTPVIVTATPLSSIGPLRPQTEYEPAASVAATRLSAQYTDTLRRRAETLIQKRLRTQVHGIFNRRTFLR